MTNPLTRSGLSQSKKVLRPEAIVPEMEAYAGHNHPYRGTEDHGVMPVDDPLPELDYADGRLAEYSDSPPDPEPIPVRIVTKGGREIRRFRPMVAYAGPTDVNGVTTPKQILAKDDSRKNATIRNSNTETIYISDEAETANVTYGYPIPQNATYQTESQEAVYASIAKTTSASVSIAVEYATAVQDND